ncbi:MAG: group II intron reverse transcriptase/maturase [Actinobacteria bacterium]|nr:group II intron reverse transcriptase/maturase [Actinomycetota bacterium]
MNDRGKSDSPVVPAKALNNAAQAVAEVVEGRGLPKGNAASNTRPGRRAGQGAPSALDRVRRIAQQEKDAKFTALLHHVDADRLQAAYWALRPKAAPGIDGVTWHEYGLGLEDNLRDLHARVHRGSYRAKPVRRAYIPKRDGRLRPLGVAALEDKILQRAVVEVLNSIYEADFLGFSYGFRPGRSPHDALDALTTGIKRRKVSWVLDADIRDYFSSLDQSWLLRFLEHRIADRRVLRLIQKWLSAGVIENGKWSGTTQGTAQGASVSPLLANVYLHYVFDMWAHQWRRRHARGNVILTRFADDYIVGFEHQDDAQRFLADLRDRLAKFTLELHPEKTRLIEFGRFAAERRARSGLRKPETFEFLGFTHICTKSRTGQFMVKRVTSKKRMQAKLSEVKTELMRRRHLPIPEQGRWLASVIRGHCNYYAVPSNSDAIIQFRTQATRHWCRALRRRSQRHRLDWERMNRLANRWLPPARLVHPYPEVRFDAKTQGRSPVR